ncbi:MAG: ABC-type transport auxiliary lipoprotein family protein [Acidihalobacter sp.]|uniref:ABC-type transport auxiliary lipoprotein family protein n=1 Tax=Acidihalobacter sp. TaxID=1872108 RepID=UPI00307D782A
MRNTAAFITPGRRAGLSAAAILATGLAGCSVLPQRPPPHALTSYRITLSDTHASARTSPACPAVRIAAPTAAAGFGGPAMRYSENPGTIANFAFHRWAAPPARMLEPILVQSVSASGLFEAVLAPDAPAGAPLQLDTQLLALLQRVTGPRSTIHLAVRASLSNVRTHRQLSAHRFVIDIPAQAANAPAGVQATDAAIGQFSHELNAWLAGLARDGQCSARN